MNHGLSQRSLDKFKPGELCNLVWSLAQLGCPPDAELLQQVVQASEEWSEVGCLSVAMRFFCVLHKHLLFATVTRPPFPSARC